VQASFSPLISHQYCTKKVTAALKPFTSRAGKRRESGSHLFEITFEITAAPTQLALPRHAANVTIGPLTTSDPGEGLKSILFINQIAA
jgi:hypothetical protein